MKCASILSALFFLALSILLSCSHGQPADKTVRAKFTAQQDVSIPRLLDRPEALRYETEWDAVQNLYGAQAVELRRNPDDVEARIKLAEIFMQEARVTGEHPHYYPAALEMLQPVIRTLESVAKPDVHQKDQLFRALSHQASIKLSLHDFEQAREIAKRAIVLNPYNAYIYGCLVDAQVELGQYAKAVEACDKMVGIRPDLRSYARVSYLREIHGDVPGAIEAMDMAVKAGYPGLEQTEWARLQLGQLYERYGQIQQAEKQYRTCLAVRENFPFALAALAGLERKNGHFKQAEDLLQQAIAIIPEVGFFLDLAKVYRQTGSKENVRKLIGQIEGMMAEDSAAGHNMNLEAARFHLELTRDLDEALRLAQLEYTLRPKNKDVNQLMAEIWLAKGRPEKAAPFMATASATGCKDPNLVALQKKTGE